MNNKVLVELMVPEIDESFNVYIPINRKIGNVIFLISRSISELTNGSYVVSSKTKLYNADFNEVYQNDKIVLDTNIRNGSKLILF